MSDWTVRSYEAGDENCVVSTWLKGYARSREVSSSGLTSAGVASHPDEIRYWQVHQPIVSALVQHGTVVVACDPARSTHEPGLPAVVWAWACVSPGAVHWVCVKRSAARAGMGPDIVRDLLGDRLEREQRMTFDLLDLARLRMIPAAWTRDRDWLAAMRALSARRLDGDDGVLARVADRILDRQRVGWEPA